MLVVSNRVVIDFK